MQTQKIPLSYEDYATGIHTLKPEELLRLMELISASLRKSLNKKSERSITEPEGLGMKETESNMPDHEESEEDMQLFWESFGSWKDKRTTEEIIKDIYGSRRSVERRIQL
ncbi:hypothetical protein QUF80_18290 [Desulfococcaceae bacterium HSG8]|nr:hypothetical protein [Desulfococcaceae bacterium HSG8]